MEEYRTLGIGGSADDVGRHDGRSRQGVHRSHGAQNARFLGVVEVFCPEISLMVKT